MTDSTRRPTIARERVCLGLYEKAMPNSLSLEDKLLESKNAGFDFLEISIDETDEKLARLKWDHETKAALVATTRNTGVRIMTMCLSGHRKYPIGSADDETRAKGMEIMSAAIDFAADTGIRIIQIAGYDEYYKPSNDHTRNLFLESLETSSEMASRKGVTLAFETMETEFMDTVRKAMRYVDLIHSPWLQVYPDLGNITNAAVRYGHKVSDDLRSATGHLVAMHLKETVPGKYREVPYGKGHVDFPSAIGIALDLGVRIFVGEFWHAGNPDWQYQLAYAHEFIRSQFDKTIQAGGTS